MLNIIVGIFGMISFTVAQVPVPTVNINKTDLVFIEGKVTHITCQTGVSLPFANITWYMGSKELDSGSTTYNSDGTTTSILSYTANKRDLYKPIHCFASNGHGFKKSHSITIYLTYPVAEVTIENKNSLTFSDGQTTLVTCRIGVSNPASEITWSIDDVAVEGGTITKEYHQTTSVLEFTAELADHDKILKCTASNDRNPDKSDTLRLNVFSENETSKEEKESSRQTTMPTYITGKTEKVSEMETTSSQPKYEIDVLEGSSSTMTSSFTTESTGKAKSDTARTEEVIAASLNTGIIAGVIVITCIICSAIIIIIIILIKRKDTKSKVELQAQAGGELTVV